jgi:polyisoprenoid-binding protein YceI
MPYRVAIAAAIVLASAPLYAATYTVDTDHTEGILRWSHIGFSNPTALFSRVGGTLKFDPASPSQSSVMVTIPLAAMTTGEPDLDQAFRSAEFFDTANFPTATFKSTKVEKLRGTQELRLTGNLSLHGMTKAVTLEVTINKVDTDPRNQLPTMGFDATTKLNRSEFGLGKYVPLVSDEIRVHITGQAAEANGYADWLKAKAAKAAAKAAATNAPNQ